jgi:2-keto-4-pentenoate hydratase
VRPLILAALATMALAAPPARAACPDTAAVARLAMAMIERRPAQGFGPGLTLEDGRCAQGKLVATLSQPWGDTVGYKLGLTNPAIQQRFGLSRPLVGWLYYGTLRERSGAEMRADFAAVPLVESDLLVRVGGESLHEAGRDHLAILRNLDRVIPFIELPDLVFARDAHIDAPNILAINIGARFGVMGEPIPVEATEEFARSLGTMTVILRDDQRELARAPGSTLLGHPLNAVAFLAEELAREGRRLRPGEYISLGSFSPMLPVQAGRTYTARYEGLLPEPVEISVRMR